MQRMLMIGICFTISACGAPQQESSLQSLQPTATEMAQVIPTKEITPPPSASERVLICKKAVALSVGRKDADAMNAEPKSDFITVSYTREDGKFWSYDCQINGNIVLHRSSYVIEPGSEPGPWRTSMPATWERQGDRIVVTDTMIENGEAVVMGKM